MAKEEFIKNLSVVLKKSLDKYVSFFSDVKFEQMIKEYEKTKCGLRDVLSKIGAGKGKGFAIARTMNIDAFCDYIENPQNNFVQRIKSGDVSLVKILSNFSSGKVIKDKHCFSAATKICTLWWQSVVDFDEKQKMQQNKSEPFVIADSYVRDAMIYLNDILGFTKLNIDNVYKNADFINWYNIIQDFQNYMGLKDFSKRDIDKSVWVLWSEYKKFPLNTYVELSIQGVI